MTEQALDQLAQRVILDTARLEYGALLKEAPEHIFSPSFERRMKKLLRRGRHPVWYKALHAAACVLLALLLSGCAVLAVSPEAREVFLGWVREFHTPTEYPPYIFYTYSGEEEGGKVPDGVVYRPTWVPEGYKVFNEGTHINGSVTIVFENGEGDNLFFSSIEGPTTNGLQLTMSEGDTMEKAEVHGRPADLYLGGPDSDSAIVWGSEDGAWIFIIQGSLHEEKESLIRMAESVGLTLPRQPPHRPSWHPEEFYLVGYIGSVIDLSATFTAEDGRVITSEYVKPKLADEKRIEIQEAVAGLTPRTVQVQGSDAELYEAEENSYLVWPTEDGLYWLYGPVEGTILLRIAESIGQEP